jgi:hypothetical protein
MGLFDDYKTRNGENSIKQMVNVEWVLKKLDNNNNADIVLADNTESSTLPATGPITTLLQTIRNCLKWLINNKAASSHTHAISDTTNLQTTLDGKSNTNHTHSYLSSIAVAHSDSGGNSYGTGDIKDVSLSVNGSTITLNRTYGGGDCYSASPCGY